MTWITWYMYIHLAKQGNLKYDHIAFLFPDIQRWNQFPWFYEICGHSQWHLTLHSGIKQHRARSFPFGQIFSQSCRWDFDVDYKQWGILEYILCQKPSLIARFKGPTWGPSGADRTQVGPMNLALWGVLYDNTYYRWTVKYLINMFLHILNFVEINMLRIVNSSPSATYMCKWTGSVLVQIMTCRLLSTRPLPEPILTYCQLDLWGGTSAKSESKFKTFHSRKCICKCRLRNGGHLSRGEMS